MARPRRATPRHPTPHPPHSTTPRLTHPTPPHPHHPTRSTHPTQANPPYQLTLRHTALAQDKSTGRSRWVRDKQYRGEYQSSGSKGSGWKGSGGKGSDSKGSGSKGSGRPRGVETPSWRRDALVAGDALAQASTSPSTVRRNCTPWHWSVPGVTGEIREATNPRRPWSGPWGVVAPWTAVHCCTSQGDPVPSLTSSPAFSAARGQSGGGECTGRTAWVHAAAADRSP